MVLTRATKARDSERTTSSPHSLQVPSAHATLPFKMIELILFGILFARVQPQSVLTRCRAGTLDDDRADRFVTGTTHVVRKSPPMSSEELGWEGAGFWEKSVRINDPCLKQSITRKGYGVSTPRCPPPTTDDRGLHFFERLRNWRGSRVASTCCEQRSEDEADLQRGQVHRVPPLPRSRLHLQSPCFRPNPSCGPSLVVQLS